MSKITLHGENEIASRRILNELTNKAKVKSITIKRIDLGDTNTSIHDFLSPDLFGEYLLLIENAGRLSKNQLQRIKESNLKEIIFYQKGSIPKGVLKDLSTFSEVMELKLSKIIYKFLDSFSPKNANKCIKLLHELEGKEADELILHLLSKYLRDLYLIKVKPEKLDYPDWRILKLENQSRNWTLNKIKEVIKKLSIVDVKLKSSNITLTSALDLLIIDELE